MIRKTLNKIAKKSKTANRAKESYKKSRDSYYKNRRVRNNQIMFESFRSSKYACSPKAIYEYMLNSPKYAEYNFVWSFKKPENYQHLLNERTKIVKYRSHKYYLEAAKSKYWVFNGWIPERMKKKPSQIMLQCWHGTPLKRLRHDIVDTATTKHAVKASEDNDEDVLRFDYFISPSRFASKAFTSAFNFKGLGKEDILIETGYPRNDYLYNYTKKDYEALKKKYKIAKGKKVILYAPTWRDRISKDQRQQGIDLDFLHEKIGKDYVILYRAHYLEAKNIDFDKYGDFVQNASFEDEVNELYVIADILVTDYSSVFFDYANLRRPMIFFMYDKDMYEKDLRGFYMDIKELPGPIIQTNEELLEEIKKNIDNKCTDAKYKKFNKKFNYLDDGKATQRAIKEMLSS